MRTAGKLTSTLVLFVLLPGLLFAQGRGTLRGRVADAQGDVIAGAQLILRGTARRTFSNRSGEYEFAGVPPGSYVLAVQSLGYRGGSASVTVSAGSEVRQDFTLEPEAVTLAALVVGSRARHTAADELAVPVDVFTAEDIQLQGSAETAVILTELVPSVHFPRQSVADATDVTRPFTMRGLSPDHALVLVNGKRRHRTALVHVFGAGMGAGSSGVDMNALPASAIDRLEVLRDGAAAQYGSDAIAGVLNLRLREGAFAPGFSASLGRYTPADFDSDGTMFDVSGAWGIPVGRGSVALFAEYRDRGETNRACPDPIDQIQPGDADVIENCEIVEKRNPVEQPNHHWGDGEAQDILTFVNARFPLNPAYTSEAYAFGGVSRREGTGNGYRRQAIDDRNWPEIYPEGFLPEFAPDVLDVSATGGVRGSMGAWSWDAAATFGHNAFEYNLTNTLNTSLGPCLDRACAPGLDGVLGNSDDPGIPNKTSFFAGELKLSEIILGLDASRIVNVGLRAPVNLALGAAFRREGYQIVAGEPASWIQGGHANRNGDAAPPGSQVFPGFQPENEVDESRTNIGAYVDLETDLASGLLAGVAARFETYNDFGEKLTGKFALRYQPNEYWTLRAAVSSGFRAPSLSQSFYASTVTNFQADPVTGEPTPFEVGIFRVDSDAAQALGARSLKEETSLNTSFGLAFGPTEAVTITADYFYIDVDDRVLLSAELASDSVAAILANRGLAAQAARYFTNAIDSRTRGIDLTARYRTTLFGSGTLDLDGVFNYTKNEIVGDIETPPELQGTDAVLFDRYFEGGLLALEEERPKWRTTLSAHYMNGAWSGVLRAHGYGKYRSALFSYAPEFVQTYNNEAVFDAEVGYALPRNLKLALGAKNLFDNFPDRMRPENSFDLFPFNSASPFGYNGRYIYARMELQLQR